MREPIDTEKMPDLGTFLVHGRPPDDFPGIPGADWGMGSRVKATDGVRSVCGLVVGAIRYGPEGWRIAVRPDGTSRGSRLEEFHSSEIQSILG